MQITILVDNNTLIDRYFQAEPGLSFYIEDYNTKILFDTGYSDIFIKNAIKLKKNLAVLDYLVLSHSHLDHTWGIEPLIKYYTELIIEKNEVKQPCLIAHPAIFASVRTDTFREFGCLMSKEKLSKHFQISLYKKPHQISKNITFLGEIPRKNDFENTLTFGRKDGAVEDDCVIEDSALVYQSKQGLVIITGCSHAGICNIIEYAKEVCNEDRIVDIIGGFHLQSPPKRQLIGTLSYLKKLKPVSVHACHCTDLSSKIALAGVVNLNEVGIGQTISYIEQ